MADIDFGTDEQEEQGKSAGTEVAEVIAGQEKKEEQPEVKASAKIESEPEVSEETSGDAVIMYEDENFIFTSEGIIDKSSSKKQENSSDAEPKKEDEKILGKFDNYDQLVKSYGELEKKLGENSDAVNKLRELNPVLPMLEAMLGDETFLGMAENYFTDPTAQAEAMKKQLGIDENFVFDLSQALSDPKSEDAKVLNKLMQVKQPKTQNQPKQSQQTSPEQKEKLMSKYGLSDAEYEEMMGKAAKHKISHDDIYFLMNKDKIIADAKKEGQSNVKKQMETAQRLKKPVSSGDATTQETSPEDAFINALSAGKGLFDE